MTADYPNINQIEDTPPIVHISDIHGYLDNGRSALRAVGESERFDPIVTSDADGKLHWADNNYVLVFNGDVIDRGPHNEGCLELVWRLQREAPQGRVQFLLGNHEMAIMLPRIAGFPGAYSTEMSPTERENFLNRILDGNVTVAFEGYDYTYSHAGSNKEFNTPKLNATLRAAANELAKSEHPTNDGVQRKVQNSHSRVFGIGKNGGRGPSAGVCWLDFTHLEPSAPKQIVGHTKRPQPEKKGNVVCGNVIRMNNQSSGGEGVLIETPESVQAALRAHTGGVVVEKVAGGR